MLLGSEEIVKSCVVFTPHVGNICPVVADVAASSGRPGTTPESNEPRSARLLARDGLVIMRIGVVDEIYMRRKFHNVTLTFFFLHSRQAAGT